MGCRAGFQVIATISFNSFLALSITPKPSARSVVVAGHSAGSHLAAMLLHDTNWQNNEPYLDLLCGMVHISGVFDLTPLVETSMNEPLHLDK